MVLSMKRAEVTPEPCSHTVRTRSGTTAGLERVVCSDCGHVSVRYLFDVLEHRYPMAAELLSFPDPATS